MGVGLEPIAYEGDVCAISQVFHPSSSSVFQSRPNGVFESPSPTFQSTFGGSVNLNGGAGVNGASFRALDCGPGPELMKTDLDSRGLQVQLSDKWDNEDKLASGTHDGQFAIRKRDHDRHQPGQRH